MKTINPFKVLWWIVVLGLLTIVFASCSSTKKAQRKLRRANKLMVDSKVLAPSLFDTVYITKRDTIKITQDSIVTKAKIYQDTTRLDSLIALYNKLKGESADPEVIMRDVYRKFIPDISYESFDSLNFVLDGDTKYIVFKIATELKNSELTVTTKALSDIEYTSEETVVNIDANRSRFYQDPYFWWIIVVLVFAAVLRVVLKNILP